MSFDIVGDIHGHADALEALLAKLGYSQTHGAWRHPSRRMIFVGDFIDRGPKQLETVNLVRRMLDAGSAQAVMGNHELNAIAYVTERDGSPRSYLREHSTKNKGQHARFLAAVGEGSPLHTELVGWFKSLPLWLDLDGFRVVHACWDESLRALLSGYCTEGNRLSDATLQLGHTKGNDVHRAVEVLLKGVEIDLPPGVTFRDKEHNERTCARLKWWDADANTYRAALLTDKAAQSQLPDTVMPAHLLRHYLDPKPVFFGHYWLDETPTLAAANAVCLDFSVAKGGYLVAYSFDGEAELKQSKLTWVAPNVG